MVGLYWTDELSLGEGEGGGIKKKSELKGAELKGAGPEVGSIHF